MLQLLSDIVGYTLHALDGELGRIKDIYFDDHTWKIRYFVVDTGSWLPGRKVLISPVSAGKPDEDAKRVPVNLTMQKIKDSPGIDAAKPVSRQHEEEMVKHFHWPVYWSMPIEGGRPEDLPPPIKSGDVGKSHKGDPALRSMNEVRGYNISALDDGMGHIDDFILDNQEWHIRFVVVDTRNWLPGKKVCISPKTISSIDWLNKKAVVNMKKKEIEQSPGLDLDASVDEQIVAHIVSKEKK